MNYKLNIIPGLIPKLDIGVNSERRGVFSEVLLYKMSAGMRG